MTNEREHKIRHKYEQDGWNSVRCGAPDWLFFKTNEQGKIIDVLFAEVKSPTGRLTIEQLIWKKIMQEYFHADYSVEIIE